MLIPVAWENILQQECSVSEGPSFRITTCQINHDRLNKYGSEFFVGPAESNGFIMIDGILFSQWRRPIYRKEIKNIPAEQNLQSIDLFCNNIRN